MSIFKLEQSVNISNADLSVCQEYRYSLWRIWNLDKPLVCFIGLNPSTADAKINDATIRRCMVFSKSWNYGGIYMVNLFAYRATDPDEMKKAIDPIGPANDKFIKDAVRQCKIVIACWGNQGDHLDRDYQVKQLVKKKLHYLQINQSGKPGHPLYLPGELVPIKWEHDYNG